MTPVSEESNAFFADGSPSHTAENESTVLDGVEGVGAAGKSTVHAAFEKNASSVGTAKDRQF